MLGFLKNSLTSILMKLAALLQKFIKQTFSNDSFAFLGTFGLRIFSFTRSTGATYHGLHKISLSDLLKRLPSKLMLLLALRIPFKRQSSILIKESIQVKLLENEHA